MTAVCSMLYGPGETRMSPPTHPHVLLAGEGELWRVALRELGRQDGINLVPVPLPLTPVRLADPGLRGVVYVRDVLSPCLPLAASLLQVWERRALPQVVVSAQLEGLFCRFPGVRTVSPAAPLGELVQALAWVSRGIPPALSRREPVRPVLSRPLLQALSWRSQGATMADIAARWQVTLKNAHSRYHRYRHSAGLTNPAEYAAVCSMASVLLQLVREQEETPQVAISDTGNLPEAV